MSTIQLSLNPRDRLELSTTIENLINMLDDLEPDPDLEPYLATYSFGHDDDREGNDPDYEPEESDENYEDWEDENEDGGDINDEPEGDDEREDDPADAGIGDADGLAPYRKPGVRNGGLLNPTLSPKDYPAKFCLQADGNCCQPAIMDKAYVLVDKERPYKPGDFVLIFRDPKMVRSGDHVMKVKRYVGEWPSSVIVETLNPPNMFGYDRRAVQAVWYCEPAPSGFVPGPLKTDGMLLAERAMSLRGMQA